MPSDDAPAGLELLVARCRAAAEEARANEAGAGGRSPAPGEVYVLAETAEFPVEWALIERHSDDLQRLWAVPADTHPFATEDDVTIPAGSPGGGIVLRCAFGAWLPEGALPPEGRSRVLAPDFLGEARRAVAAARERRRADPSWQASGGSPELFDWSQEILVPACAAAAARPVELAAIRPPRSRLPRWLPWAAAAGLLVVIASLLAGWLGQRREIEESTRTAANLRLARSQAEDHFQQRMDALEREARDESQHLQRQIAELAGGSSGAVPLVNPPSISLRPAEVLRTEPSVVRIPAESPYLLAFLAPPSGAHFPAYRLALLKGTKILWSQPLSEVRDETIRVLLPRRLLSPGVLRLRLEGLRPGRNSLVAEYSLNVAR